MNCVEVLLGPPAMNCVEVNFLFARFSKALNSVSTRLCEFGVSMIHIQRDDRKNGIMMNNVL
jgi:hypothetical protein